jgi:hypothetical protein
MKNRLGLFSKSRGGALAEQAEDITDGNAGYQSMPLHLPHLQNATLPWAY